MNSMTRTVICECALFLLIGISVRAAEMVPGAACSAVVTEKAPGAYDLSAIPKGATIFRAEVFIEGDRPIGSEFKPTLVYPEGHPDKPLAFVPPWFRSLDALDAARAAAAAGKPLVLKAVNASGGLGRLEVSYTGGKSKAENIPVVTNVKAVHRNGQTLITFTEPKLDEFPEFKSGKDVEAFAKTFAEKHPGLSFRIWRGPKRITPATIAEARCVGRCGFFSARFSGWPDGKARTFSVADRAEPVPWGTGVYAHNPPEPGKAFYAVTVALNGEEDLTRLDDQNTTADAVDETVGLGDPVLQWKTGAPDKEEQFVYVRWESWPNSSAPDSPHTYLVKFPAKRVEHPPVSLNLHGWGGSLIGGGNCWWNTDKGTVWISSNEVPYDWWTGYHERRGTEKTWGDGHVHPFTMNRMLGFMDWAVRKWNLDPTRALVDGNSMGGSGAPMFAIRFGDKIAWACGWVGVHIPRETSWRFVNSYTGNYGPPDKGITMPDGKTSPWDFFDDAWFLRAYPKRETGFVMASNGHNDNAIGWPQAVKFAKALQDTRRPHMYNWAVQGHATHTLFKGEFDQDIRTDQTLPAFSRCSLDDNLDKDDQGQLNAFLRWKTDDIVDQPGRWEMTVILLGYMRKVDKRPENCTVDLTPRRLQKFETPKGARFHYTVTDLQTKKELAAGEAVADDNGLLTLPQVPLAKGQNRVAITAAK